MIKRLLITTFTIAVMAVGPAHAAETCIYTQDPAPAERICIK